MWHFWMQTEGVFGVAGGGAAPPHSRLVGVGGVRAVGVSGEDAGMFRAEPKDGGRLGRTGEPTAYKILNSATPGIVFLDYLAPF